jgi:hypothetical protein
VKETFIRSFQEDSQQKSSPTVAVVPKLWCRLSEIDIYPLNFGVDQVKSVFIRCFQEDSQQKSSPIGEMHRIPNHRRHGKATE